MNKYHTKLKCVLYGGWNDEVLGVSSIIDLVRDRVLQSTEEIDEALNSEDARFGLRIDTSSLFCDVECAKPERAYLLNLAFEITSDIDVPSNDLEKCVRDGFAMWGIFINREVPKGSSYDEYALSWPWGELEKHGPKLDSNGYGLEVTVSRA